MAVFTKFAESVGCKPKEHQFSKNWDSSSQAMEADIILEGFLKANEYGVRYMTVIADGDSSTYACIQEGCSCVGYAC